MAPSPIIILCAFCLLFFHLQTTRGKQVTCNTLRCGNIDIQFPFGLKGSNQDLRCSYYPIPTFQLSCINGSQTILTLPRFGDLLVKRIDYESQSIQVNDPSRCLPKRFLHKWNLSDSTFMLNPVIYGTSFFNLTFLRCPSNVTDATQFPLVPVSCLSENKNYSVIVSWTPPIVSSPMMPQRCEVMSRALVPVPVMDMPMWPYWPDLNTDLNLVWSEPTKCRECSVSGQLCGFTKTESLQLGCFPKNSRKGKFHYMQFYLFFHYGPSN